MNVIAADLKILQFMNKTSSQEYKAKQYLTEFNNNLEKAVEKYKERQNIINDFSKKNGLPAEQAE